VFLFDEPLSNLDANLRVQMRTEISRLHHQLQTTMIYVTHDQIEAMSMGDRIVVMRDGVVQQVDTPLKIYHKPANRFVAGFIGSPTMNFLTGKIERNNGIRFRQEGTDFSVELGSANEERLKGITGGSVTMGIRPEHLYTHPPAGIPTLAKFKAGIEVVEPSGTRSSSISVPAEGASASRASPRKIPPWWERTHDMLLDVSKIHFFDPATDVTL